jgi:hypothetical protein
VRLDDTLLLCTEFITNHPLRSFKLHLRVRKNAIKIITLIFFFFRDRPNSMQSFLILAPDTLCSSLSLNDDILMNAFCLIIAPLLLPTAIILGCYHLSQWKFKLFLNTILGPF